MSRFANLADKSRVTTTETEKPATQSISANTEVPPSRVGRKVISGYFSQEMSLAMHMCARQAGVSLQTLMAEAFNDVLRKHGKSPAGE